MSNDASSGVGFRIALGVTPGGTGEEEVHPLPGPMTHEAPPRLTPVRSATVFNKGKSYKN